MDLLTHQPLLEQLIPLLNAPDFDALFAQLTSQVDTSTRFLLRMELKRLTSPCVRVMDLRSQHPCEAFSHAGIQHFLDEADIRFFKQQLRLYQDRYTTGVYEAMMAYARQRRSQPVKRDPLAASQTESLDVDAVRFGGYHLRSEERMHFSSAVRLHLEGLEPLETRTSDISVNGIRLLLDAPLAQMPPTGTECQLTFVGLYQEEPLSLLRREFSYQVLGLEQRQGRQWLKLLRTDPDPRLSAYLHRLIETRKPRYGVHVDHLVDAVAVKGYEQFFLPRMTGLPLFFSQAPAPRLRYVLRSENSQHELEYWRNEHNQDMLGGLFYPERMARLLAQPQPLKETLIYCFTHTLRSHIFFFSATRDELEQSGLRQLFFNVGARRPSWRVYKLSLEATTLTAEQRQRLLPEGEGETGYQAQIQQQLGELAWVGLLQAVDDEHQRADYLSEPQPDQDANRLQIFAHTHEAPPFEQEFLHYAQLRKEPRYIHKTAVVVKLGDQKRIGWTRDLSTRGLQLELESALPCQVGAPIHIALPKLQELAPRQDLSALPYRVVHTNPTHTVLHLCVDGDPAQHAGSQFFTRLIDSNRDKLKSAQEQRRYRGLASALRNLYAQHLFTVPLYLNKHQPSRLGAIGMVRQPRSLLPLLRVCRQEKPFNLSPLLGGELLKQALLLPLGRCRREDRPMHHELFVRRQADVLGKPVFEIRLEQDFADREAKRAFVAQGLASEGFYSVRLFASRTGRPDMEYVARELDYIAKYAIHKAKQLEETLWSIIGICDLVDTTEATLFRLGLRRP